MPQWEDLLAITTARVLDCQRLFRGHQESSSPPILILDDDFWSMSSWSSVREDIHETKKLNVHLFNALRKAPYTSPPLFSRVSSFLSSALALCTLREAHIVSGVLARASIPVLHSAAALMRLTDIAAEQSSMLTEGGGATNIFIRTLLEKKYALPYKVIDNLVFHFFRFRLQPAAHDPRASPTRDPPPQISSCR